MVRMKAPLLLIRRGPMPGVATATAYVPTAGSHAWPGRRGGLHGGGAPRPCVRPDRREQRVPWARRRHPRRGDVEVDDPLDPVGVLDPEQERGEAAPVVTDDADRVEALGIEQTEHIVGERQLVVAAG